MSPSATGPRGRGAREAPLPPNLGASLANGSRGHGRPGRRSRAEGATLNPPTAARLALRRVFVGPSWVLLGVLSFAFAVASAAGLGGPPYWVQCLPFVASLALFGLPHGAVDHLAPARLLGRRATPGPALGVALLYLVLSGLYLSLWFAAPLLAFATFIVLTWFHWGQGDVYSLTAITRARYLEDRAPRALAVIMRGGLPMLVPLLAFPGAYREVARDLTGLLGAGAAARSAGMDWAFGSSFRIFAGVSFAALVAAALVLGHRRARSRAQRRAWREDAFETALLAAFFALVPPLLAVGLYFCLWHSVRHVGRLMLLDPTSPLRAGSLLPALAAFFREAAPLTALASVLLVGLYFVVPGTGGGASDFLGVYLVLISTLTLPHVAVVLWMDREEGLFSGDRSRGAR